MEEGGANVSNFFFLLSVVEVGLGEVREKGAAPCCQPESAPMNGEDHLMSS